VRASATRERLLELMRELARTAPRKGHYRVYLVGGGTAVYLGWRPSSLDVDLSADQEAIFHDIQGIKERLNINIEFASPEHFVPPLPGTADRHIPIETIGRVSFYHFDPYAQALSKIVRGFDRDMDDAKQFLESGLVDGPILRDLVSRIPEASFARYPSLSRSAIVGAVEQFLSRRG